MKTLVLNGSPRVDGDSMSIVKEIVKYLNGDVVIINAYNDKISPCTDCRYCWEHGVCSINDRMNEVYDLLDEVDNLIISSPLHYSELSGQLLSLISRFQVYYARRIIRKESDFKLKRKKGVIILTGGGDGNISAAIDRVNIVFRQTNSELAGQVLSMNTNAIPAKEDKKAMKEAKELALLLNDLFERKSS
ncbi:MAG: flavodoxin family protein [Clostridia bacterium]|nr:flavodoxin family protein [Clostridia bacterium]